MFLAASSSDEDSCAGDSELPPPPEMGSPPARRPAAPHPRALPHPLPQPHHMRDKKHAPKERTEIDLSEISAHLPACKYSRRIEVASLVAYYIDNCSHFLIIRAKITIK